MLSQIRLNISDAARVVNREVQSGFGDALVVALTVEPKTIDELGLALAWFIKPQSERSPFKWIHEGANFEPNDAGVGDRKAGKYEKNIYAEGHWFDDEEDFIQ